MHSIPHTDGETKIVALIHDAGGRIVGRTRLQKIAYLLQRAGMEQGFQFDYHHYGPYSEDLASAAERARVRGLIKEEERRAAWGGFYSVYTATGDSVSPPLRKALVTKAIEANSILLELAATAAYLADKGYADPWEETALRKPDKAKDGRLKAAQALYGELQAIASTLPALS